MYKDELSKMILVRAQGMVNEADVGRRTDDIMEEKLLDVDTILDVKMRLANGTEDRGYSAIEILLRESREEAMQLCTFDCLGVAKHLYESELKSLTIEHFIDREDK